MARDSIILILILVLFAAILVLSFFKSTIKGIFGEKQIGVILSFLNKSQYKILNNVVLEIDGRTSQIDHLVISDFGIFVIETKNYKGWILGNEHSEYWTQVLFQRKEKLYNPIRQNKGHILTLKKCLAEYNNVRYISIIVFSSSSELKVEATTDVTQPFKLLNAIKRYAEVNLSEQQKNDIYLKIQSANLGKTYDKKSHIESIRKRVITRERLIYQGKCPFCQSDLLQRTGKFGSFLGCSNFPRCKFTRKI